MSVSGVLRGVAAVLIFASLLLIAANLAMPAIIGLLDLPSSAMDRWTLLPPAGLAGLAAIAGAAVVVTLERDAKAVLRIFALLFAIAAGSGMLIASEDYSHSVGGYLSTADRRPLDEALAAVVQAESERDTALRALEEARTLESNLRSRIRSMAEAGRTHNLIASLRVPGEMTEITLQTPAVIQPLITRAAERECVIFAAIPNQVGTATVITTHRRESNGSWRELGSNDIRRNTGALVRGSINSITINTIGPDPVLRITIDNAHDAAGEAVVRFQRLRGECPDSEVGFQLLFPEE
ncbi:hypothetical protein [Maricaulis sp.]|uniref:hypothetical protein n=1 Tax=Maricaulis sp. TaxID=1486257 RepID=UPI00261E58DE|nr:hypothetical protein [Maricaulis sp.]